MKFYVLFVFPYLSILSIDIIDIKSFLNNYLKYIIFLRSDEEDEFDRNLIIIIFFIIMKILIY